MAIKETAHPRLRRVRSGNDGYGEKEGSQPHDEDALANVLAPYLLAAASPVTGFDRSLAIGQIHVANRRSIPLAKRHRQLSMIDGKASNSLDYSEDFDLIEQVKRKPKINHSDPKIMSGKTLSETIRKEIKQEVEEMQNVHGIVPGLAVVMVGNRADSATYVKAKNKFAQECGFHVEFENFPESVDEGEVLDWIERMNNDHKVHGILCQLPLPTHMDEQLITNAICVSKDVDGFSAYNVGATALKGGSPYAISCTPLGIMEMMKRYKVDISGKKAVVLGRSNIVGMPLALLLNHADATVTMCHSKTENLEELVREADIVCAAMGKPYFVKGSWIKEGAVVIDVGIHAITIDNQRKLVGDVEFATAYERASLITPVPGGVGAMTVTMLLRNTLNLCKRTHGIMLDDRGQSQC